MTDLSSTMVSLGLTYLLHSSIFLTTAWIISLIVKERSFALSERIWKFAVLGGFVTAPIQIALGLSANLLDDSLATDRSPSFPTIVAHQAEEFLDVNVEDPIEVLPESPSEDVATLVVDSIEPTVDGIVDVELEIPFATAKEEISDFERTAMPSSSDSTATGRDTSILEGIPSFDASSLASVFCAFVLIGLFRILWQEMNFRRHLASAVASSNTSCSNSRARRVLNRLAERNGIRRNIRILMSDQFAEPVVFGLFRWTIVLPHRLEDQLSNEELRALLAHEVAHLARGDIWWLWLGRILCSCFAFQPLNFVARSRWQQATEYLCDDWAVHQGVSGLTLARCLTQVAQFRHDAHHQPALAAGGQKKTIVRRVERLVNAASQSDRWSMAWGRRVLAVAGVVVLFCFCQVVPHCGVSATQAADEIPVPDDLESSSSRAATDEDDLLSREIEELKLDLERVEELLRRLPNDPEFQTFADRLRRRVSQINSN